MIENYEITRIFGSLAFLAFIFLFWRDANKEGYSSDKILDTSLIILFGGVLGGKVLFRNLSLGYFRYQILTSPLILEGVLVGGLLSVWYVSRKNHWELWKIGDMIAPSLTFAQFIFFLGFWLSTKYASFLITSFLFLWLYLVLFYLKSKFHYGSSFNFHAFKRLNIKLFSGGLFITYLTGSSLIAMIFLVSHRNVESSFWWFQVVFYLTLLIVSFLMYLKQLRMQKIGLGMIDNLLDKLKGKLKNRKANIEKELTQLTSEDPFKVEMENELGRNADELGDEVTEQVGHSEILAEKEVLDKEKEEIERTLKKINTQTYGKCERCGKEIDPARLEAYPTTRYCLACEKELEQSD